MEYETKEFDITDECCRENGKSVYTCKCPFCKREMDIQKWSFRSVGKKCDCGAVLRGGIANRKIAKSSSK